MISFGPDRAESTAPAEDNFSFSHRSRAELREQVDTFYRNAELRTRLQNIYPDWQPTDAHRFVVGIMRDVGARLHPRVLEECPFPVEGTPEATTTQRELQSPQSPEQVALETRALFLFERSLKNVARYLRNEPVEETIDGELRSALCAPSSDRYRGEYLGSLWAVQAALYAFRDNEHLLRETFETMRRNLPDMLVIFSDENSFNQLMSTMLIIARRSETFKAGLLRQEWLSLREDDVSSSLFTYQSRRQP